LTLLFSPQSRNAIAARLHETRLRRSLQRISRKAAKTPRKTTKVKKRDPEAFRLLPLALCLFF
jgi:hypothetical protein